MPDNEYRWLNRNEITSNEESKGKNNYFTDEKIVSCQLTKLYFFSEKRNSYGNEFDADHGIHINIDLLKRNIENKRKSGSFFEIQEVAALALSGKKTSIVLVPYNAKDTTPFFYMKEIDLIEKKLTSIQIFADYINELCVDALDFYYTDKANLNTFTSPLVTYNSIVYGSLYYENLGFYEPTTSNKQDITYLLNIYAALHTSVTETINRNKYDEFMERVRNNEKNS